MQAHYQLANPMRTLDFKLLKPGLKLRNQDNLKTDFKILYRIWKNDKYPQPQATKMTNIKVSCR